jgi:hypothetical protein
MYEFKIHNWESVCNIIGLKSHTGEAQYTQCYRDENKNNLGITNRLLKDNEGHLYKMICYEGKKLEKVLLHRGIIIKSRAP